MTLAIFVALAVAVPVVVDTLVPLGDRSGLGVRRGAARRAVAALRNFRTQHAPARAVSPGKASENRVPEPRREAEPAGRGPTVAPSRGRRPWNGGPARTGRPHRAAAKASLS